MLKVAELCAGYGGLYLAMRLLEDADLAWYAEVDLDASTLLAHHHPGIPNLGDITEVEWPSAASVDVLAGGFPCQPWSLGGKRDGADDERDLWPVRKYDADGQPRRGMLDAIAALRPPVVLLENVPGLLTGDRGSAWRTILHDLDLLGYTTRWTVLGACKLGLCHHRHRLFALATLADGDTPIELGMPIEAWTAWPRDGVCAGGYVWSETTDECGNAGMVLPTPCASDGNPRGTGLGTYQSPEGRPLREVVAMLPTPTRSDGTGGAGYTSTGGQNLRTAVTNILPTPVASPYGSNMSGSEHAAVRPSLERIAQMLPTPTANMGDGSTLPSAQLASSRRAAGRRMLDDAVALLPTPRASDATKGGPNQRGSRGDLGLPAAAQPERWGDWATAVARHARIIGRPAPEPTITGRRGGCRLNPALTEWMQALPEGHITGPVADPNAANRLAGNGVVPAVAAAAVLRMLGRAGWTSLPTTSPVGGGER